MTLSFKDGWFMVLNATLNNISVILWWLVLLVEETKVPGENFYFRRAGISKAKINKIKNMNYNVSEMVNNSLSIF